jgi:hypothetical protein
LFFFLCKQSPVTENSFERAVQIYQESTYDTSIKQAVEKLFRASHVDHAFSKNFKHSHINHKLLAEGAIQVALSNLLCMNFTI